MVTRRTAGLDLVPYMYTPFSMRKFNHKLQYVDRRLKRSCLLDREANSITHYEPKTVIEKKLDIDGENDMKMIVLYVF